MQVKRFEGVDIHEVLRLIKNELGPDAVILSTRHIRKGRGTFGMFGRPMVEVTAAIDRNETHIPTMQPAAERRPRSETRPHPALRETSGLVRLLDPLQQDIGQVKELLNQLAAKERLAPKINYSGLERELVVLTSMLEHLLQKQKDPGGIRFEPALMPYFQRLLASGVEETLARVLTANVQQTIAKDKLAQERYVRGYFANQVMQSIPICGALRLLPGYQTVATFVGPTGVGKTTTIAKLAAHYGLAEKKKVALLTLDTYRIAAVEQLRTFAKIIDLPLDVVRTKEALDQALERHQDKDLVLIDTAGRSQRDELQMAELMACFDKSRRTSVHLVLSATASAQNLFETVERFKPLDLASLVITKLDESHAYGTLLGLVMRENIPISYFTTGQRVPEDIEIATAERLVDLILNLSQWVVDEKPQQEDIIA